MSEPDTDKVDLVLEDEDFFEPTIEEAIMASGMHRQYVPIAPDNPEPEPESH
jgi:hypothetical protein